MLKEDDDGLDVTTMDAAARLLADAAEWESATDILLEAAMDEPWVVGRWLLISEWQRQKGDLTSAARTLRKAIRANRGYGTRKKKTCSDSDMLDLYQALAETALEAQDWFGAMAASRTMIHLAPRHHLAREILATALLQDGQIEEAELVMRELLQISPRDPLHRLRLATLLQLQGRLGESLIEFRRVLEAYPDMPLVQEANEAIEALDRMQTQQILMRASEQTVFRLAIERNLDETLEEFGFVLSENGYEALRQIVWDGHFEEDDFSPIVFH